MSAENENPIVQLAELLASEERIEWDIVEDLVADVPGWLRLVQLMREPARNITGGYTGRGSSPESGLVVARTMRARLHEIFAPYAILLDTRLTPAERALRLKFVTGRDPLKFTEECLQAQIPEVVEAALVVREAAQSEETLLRGAAAPHTAPEELLRVGGLGELSREDLLLPAGMPIAIEPAHRVLTWLQRLFSRRKA